MRTYPKLYAVVLIAVCAAPVYAADAWADRYQAGLDFFERRDYARARDALLKALLEVQSRTPVDWQFPTTLHTLGVTEQALGQRLEARHHLEAAVNLWGAIGDNGCQTSVTRESLGNLLSDEGDWETADREFQAAVSIRERIYGASSLEVAATLTRVAGAYLSWGELRKAKPLLDRALDTQSHLLPAGELAVLTTRIMLAHALRGMGDFKAARAHASAAESAGRQSSLYPEILAVLGDVYRREGNPARAVPLLRQAITLAAARGSEQELPAAVVSLAHIDLLEGRLAAARDGFERGIAMIQRLWGPGSPEVASAQIGLAAVMLEERRPEEASVLLDAAHPHMARAFRDDRLFQAIELILRASLSEARGGRGSTGEAVRSAWDAIEREEPRNQAGLWGFCAVLMRPYRPDLAKAAAKRTKALSRNHPAGTIATEFRNQRGN